MGVRRALTVAATTIACCGAVVGCGAVAGREDAAAATATRFLRAVADGDGAAACALLAPKTVEEVERSAGTPCGDAVVDEDLPEPGPVRTSDVYGQWAWVVLPDDTLFLAVFPAGWRVVAAGCRPAGEDRPYDCEVQGG